MCAEMDWRVVLLLGCEGFQLGAEVELFFKGIK